MMWLLIDIASPVISDLWLWSHSMDKATCEGNQPLRRLLSSSPTLAPPIVTGAIRWGGVQVSDQDQGEQSRYIHCCLVPAETSAIKDFVRSFCTTGSIVGVRLSPSHRLVYHVCGWQNSLADSPTVGV